MKIVTTLSLLLPLLAFGYLEYLSRICNTGIVKTDHYTIYRTEDNGAFTGFSVICPDGYAYDYLNQTELDTVLNGGDLTDNNIPLDTANYIYSEEQDTDGTCSLYGMPKNPEVNWNK